MQMYGQRYATIKTQKMRKTEIYSTQKQIAENAVCLMMDRKLNTQTDAKATKLHVDKEM